MDAVRRTPLIAAVPKMPFPFLVILSGRCSGPSCCSARSRSICSSGEATRLDVRIPIGALFAVLGMLLAGYGLAGGPALTQRSLGVDVDLWRGLAMLAFGALMLWLAWRAGRRPSGGPS